MAILNKAVVRLIDHDSVSARHKDIWKQKVKEINKAREGRKTQQTQGNENEDTVFAQLLNIW